jgi:hypothetical protein
MYLLKRVPIVLTSYYLITISLFVMIGAGSGSAESCGLIKLVAFVSLFRNGT